MGAVKKNDIKTPHDAVRYCTNTPIEYKLPTIKSFFKSFFLVIYLELYRLRPSKMGAYVTTTFNTDPNAVKYCSNTAKMAYIAGNRIFLGMFQIFLGVLVSLAWTGYNRFLS